MLQLRPAAGERIGEVENPADLDLLFLGVGRKAHRQRRHRGKQSCCEALPQHRILPRAASKPITSVVSPVQTKTIH
jgi:hypothetical protein